jgi:hypothetical protein
MPRRGAETTASLIAVRAAAAGFGLSDRSFLVGRWFYVYLPLFIIDAAVVAVYGKANGAHWFLFP